ncbi:MULTISPECIES: ergothioneine biosynthesis protein EgtC [unclassified Coleofasciculus]|uniref:ergothioneine biosynthesis protein EgtC n=1 Tax=unclassified Coleofasciculus TaxID=2692782 RepID=UPI00187FE71F|nr:MULTISPECIES: ergothioneine biosynthesis protein EgtC [unclassified Coleofasciculus]MBE9126578.1 ergothioneine biosynthesis protein EgtC [Coleofasciculus sp. LEGE 07081]MBE9149941.1 ergothioneine biosynthesis protein EgtC [Coleofasciculus sp. LEGE 07092]
MCRLLAYLGSSIQLNRILYKPEHSLIVQSYQPKEMTAGVVNADGLGVGWYHPRQDVEPFTYKNTLPIWNDTNLPELSRYVESGCVLAYIRSATPGQGLDVGNCQPFRRDRLLFTHNGFISNFRQSLYRPIRDRLSDEIYQSIHGTTDSEHIFALLVNELQAFPNCSIQKALHNTLTTLTQLAKEYQVSFSANVVVSDGHCLIASRHAYGTSTPTLYWLSDNPNYPDSVIIASEPLFAGNWHSCPEGSIINVKKNLDVCIEQLI